jgi:hypothetical protein
MLQSCVIIPTTTSVSASMEFTGCRITMAFIILEAGFSNQDLIIDCN